MFIDINEKFNGPVVMAVRRSKFQENHSNPAAYGSFSYQHMYNIDFSNCCIGTLCKV